MRIVVHGQQAFGKAVFETLLERGQDVVAVYGPPEAGRPDPLAEAASAAGLPLVRPPRRLRLRCSRQAGTPEFVRNMPLKPMHHRAGPCCTGGLL